MSTPKVALNEKIRRETVKLMRRSHPKFKMTRGCPHKGKHIVYIGDTDGVASGDHPRYKDLGVVKWLCCRKNKKVPCLSWPKTVSPEIPRHILDGSSTLQELLAQRAELNQPRCRGRPAKDVSRSDSPIPDASSVNSSPVCPLQPDEMYRSPGLPRKGRMKFEIAYWTSADQKPVRFVVTNKYINMMELIAHTAEFQSHGIEYEKELDYYFTQCQRWIPVKWNIGFLIVKGEVVKLKAHGLKGVDFASI